MLRPLLITVLSLSAAPAPAAEPLRLATQERPPYVHMRPDGTLDGTAVRVVECALRKMEHPFTMQLMPWARVLVMAEKGHLDGFFPSTYQSERSRWAAESMPIADQHWVWYLRSDSTLDPLSLEFRQQAKVGAHFGSIRLKMLEDENYHVVLSSQSDKALLQAFAAGRADAILGSDQALEMAVQELKLDPKDFRIVPVRNTPQHIFFNKSYLAQHPGFLEQFNAHVPACRKVVK
jgi:polar amino acid transport system substrate-binding protein